MSKNPKYKTLWAVESGLLQSCSCPDQRRSGRCLLEQHRGTSAGNEDVENSSKNKQLYARKEPRPTEWIPSR